MVINHSLILTELGKVYTWGLILGPRSEPLREPQLVNGFNLPIVEIACGQYFSVARDTEGNVFQWGCKPTNLGGNYVSEPCKVTNIPPHAHSLHCGMTDSSILCLDGKVLQWNWFDLTARPIPELLKYKVKQYSMGWMHSAAIVEV
jgi:hypothetical protein